MNISTTDLAQASEAAVRAVSPQAKPLELAVVLPTYNERKNIATMIERLDKALAGIAWEAIYVDDNSPDGTSDEARRLSLSDPRVRCIQRIGRRGLASAAIEGMCSTAAPVVAVMDADHQHDPALLPGMLKAVASGEYDLAYASRFAEGASTEAWGRPDRVKASGFANRIANKVTGVELTDPMSGFFMLRTQTLRADAHRLSGVGFKILLDILATVDTPLRVKEFPLNFAARAEGESKLDQTVVFEFLVGLYDKWLGRIIPTRFALFGTVGAMGVVVQLAVLWTMLHVVFGERFVYGNWSESTTFNIANTIAALVAMTFNFVLNNELTYSDKRLRGFAPLMRGWAQFALTCSLGLLTNIGSAAVLKTIGIHDVLAVITGVLLASVFNFALSSKFVWGKY
ncbi:glycosyltransferase family 2 protein [Novosphingobium resinovorum]|uniref:Dolichol monophosphate mannose synthase n=1 Tax=Novosphingobium resinovorum TaxID=158500 RepID=A0A031K454_9SPHN|nr:MULTISPECIES: glycosyltransferase family 2 protein [Sphingomonadaceae]AOR76701.1 dolichol monophosphate mannose synthase [Novosphingobium resinovorum]EJU10053.1 dolichol-phosphate mannosyltransferase [Sphingomonas sp. LH128]EZP83788.1 Dolichol-phosphate mannosyltransferase [Novosphingobium resinovorum]MBF7012048.1 glycosyltransferase family 2 protein [Novosphingobium sp. HR1a]WJM26798.1 glycosyltransferase family 2 protein [Novosphingobium resinovorum]